jgi:ubiquinone biosynthesis protein COQ9
MAMQDKNTMEQARERLLAAALPHVAFDGWTEACFRAAVTDSGLDAGLARALCPRGGIDLAVTYHKAGDARMVERLGEADLTALRFRDRIARAVLFRLDGADRELVRRGSALFALPQHAGEGAGLIWGTADAIWRALGDSSNDLNWYTKRATLSAVYASTVLFWLGDTSEDGQATKDFLNRRIDNVMQFEKAKAAIRGNPLGKVLARGPLRLLNALHAPRDTSDLPGHQG